jgi:signal transduction histidine kinase
MLGLGLFFLVTRRLESLTRSISAFDAADFSGELQLSSHLQKSTDEIGRLASAFTRMAERMAMQLQQIKHQDDARREMLAHVSHDLRTPLTSMQGYLETLQRKSNQLAPEERDHYLSVAVRQSQRVAHLALELFELATLESQDVKPNFELFSLPDLIQDVLQKFALTARARQIRINVRFVQQVPQIYADIGMIERVLSNLLDNALRYTPVEGQIEIALTGNPGEPVWVQVEDNGPGIAAVDLPQLFQRDSRLRQIPRQHAGAGLGLLITQHILQLHGSVIEVRSTPGTGTRFRFHLSSSAPLPSRRMRDSS